MGKIKSAHQSRSIVQKRRDHPTSLFVSIPKRIVGQWQLRAGDIVEWVFITEGYQSYVKVRKVETST